MWKQPQSREVSLSLLGCWAQALGRRGHLVWVIVRPMMDVPPMNKILIPVCYPIAHAGRLQGSQGLALSEVRA